MELYRYMSFFELYKLINDKKLKFSKLSLMDDDNEGLGGALDSLLPSEFNYSGFNKSHDEIKKYHEQIKDTSYITCWSKEKNSMAMWLLYSKNKDYIRVKTSYKKLEDYTRKFSHDNSWVNHLNSPKGTMQTNRLLSSIDAVEYVDFHEVFLEIENLHKKEKESLDNLYKNLKPEEILLSDGEKELKIREESINKASNIIPDWKSSLSLKDKAYKYEEEIRASIVVNRRNGLSYNDYKNCDTSDEFNILFEGSKTSDDDFPIDTFSKILEVDVGSDFVEEICFDPRMPSYQVEIYKDILDLSGIEIVITNIFGLISEERNLGMGYYSGSEEDKKLFQKI